MNHLNKLQDIDAYEIEEPSDEDRAATSSEDELDVLLNGTPEQKKKLIREYLTGESESSSNDEFEKEMEAELSSTLKTLEESWGVPGPGSISAGGVSGETAGGSGGSGPAKPKMYDKIYFDSDEDSPDEEAPSSSSGRRRRQRVVLTNNELFYDPEEDDRDQAWVDARRRQYRSRKRAVAGGRAQSPGLSPSDAVLNCPACMTTLCLDCQRHQTYRTQYRAMFVMNCTVRRDEVLRYKDSKQKPRRRKRRKCSQTGEEQAPDPAPVGIEVDEIYHPVQCSECNTEVAVYDKDDVYHFFNILASHC